MLPLRLAEGEASMTPHHDDPKSCPHRHVRFDYEHKVQDTGGFFCADCGADLNGQKWPLTLGVTTAYNDIP